jgi:hypothetical protein
MKRRAEWQPVLDAEMKRWSAMSWSELTSRLSAEDETYQVEYQSKTYQVEVTILGNTEKYLHVAISVDDGHFWRAMSPLASSFICNKSASSGTK